MQSEMIPNPRTHRHRVQDVLARAQGLRLAGSAAGPGANIGPRDARHVQQRLLPAVPPNVNMCTQAKGCADAAANIVTTSVVWGSRIVHAGYRIVCIGSLDRWCRLKNCRYAFCRIGNAL
jgi:hypothetical protein